MYNNDKKKYSRLLLTSWKIKNIKLNKLLISNENLISFKVSDTSVVQWIFIYGELHVGLERFGFQYQNIGSILSDAQHSTAKRSFYQYEKSRKRRHIATPPKSIEQHSTDDS